MVIHNFIDFSGKGGLTKFQNSGAPFVIRPPEKFWWGWDTRPSYVLIIIQLIVIMQTVCAYHHISYNSWVTGLCNTIITFVRTAVGIFLLVPGGGLTKMQDSGGGS